MVISSNCPPPKKYIRFSRVSQNLGISSLISTNFNYNNEVVISNGGARKFNKEVQNLKK